MLVLPLWTAPPIRDAGGEVLGNAGNCRSSALGRANLIENMGLA